METYRLNSRLVEKDREYTIQTTNDIGTGSISSEVFVNGALADATQLPHPEQAQPEEVLALVKSTHGDKKQEVETLLKSYLQALESANPEMMYHLGLALFYKRLEAGTYQMPVASNETGGVEIDATHLALLLSGVDQQSAKRRKRYLRVA